MIRLLSLVSLFLLTFTSCENDLEKINEVAHLNDGMSETGKNVEIYYTDSIKVKVKMLAQKLVQHQGEEPYTEMPEGVKVLFYNDIGNIENTLTANKGFIYDHKNEMIAKENVVAISSKGEKLETEELIWNEDNGKIFSNKFVKITTEDEIIFGDGFEANQDFTNYEIKKIKGQINLKEDEIL